MDVYPWYLSPFPGNRNAPKRAFRRLAGGRVSVAVAIAVQARQDGGVGD